MGRGRLPPPKVRNKNLYFFLANPTNAVYDVSVESKESQTETTMTTLGIILSGLTGTTASSKPAILGAKVSLWRQIKSLFSNEPLPGSYEAMVRAMAPRK